MAFLEHLRDTTGSFSMVRNGKQFLSIIRSITGNPLSQSNMFLLDKYVKASFNTNPPKVRKQSHTWDVNILLDHFVKMGPNTGILTNKLVGKLALQLLLTQMCRSGEIAMLKLSCMRLLKGGVKFDLPKLTKTFTAKSSNKLSCSRLQCMKILPYRANPLLCPLTTLLCYIERTKFRRGNVDELFVLVTQQQPKHASQTTINRWAKNIMRDAGLESFSIHSTWGASSTSAFLMGLPIDQIVSRVGWLRSSTFVRHYLKPLTTKKSVTETVSTPPEVDDEEQTIAVLLPDPHGYAQVIGNCSPKVHSIQDTPAINNSFRKKLVPDNEIAPGPTTVSVPHSKVLSPSEELSDDDEHKLVIVEHDVQTDEYKTVPLPDLNLQSHTSEVVRETVNADPDISWLQAMSKPPPPPPPGHLNLKSPVWSDMSSLPSFNDSFGLSATLSPSPFSSTPIHPLDPDVLHKASPTSISSVHSLSMGVRHVYPPVLHNQPLRLNVSALLQKKQSQLPPRPNTHTQATGASTSCSIIGPPMPPSFYEHKNITFGRKKPDPKNNVWSWIDCSDPHDNSHEHFKVKPGTNWNFHDESKSLIPSSHHGYFPLTPLNDDPLHDPRMKPDQSDSD